MIRWLISNRLGAAERQIGVSLDYLRHMHQAAPAVFYKFLKLKSLANHRRVLPDDVLHVARIVAARRQDCGQCLQMAVNFALQQGMPAGDVQPVIDEDVEKLPSELVESYRFAESVVTNSDESERWRETVRQRYGDEGVIELSLAVAIAGVFPTMKRGMGYATSCSQTRVAVPECDPMVN